LFSILYVFAQNIHICFHFHFPIMHNFVLSSHVKSTNRIMGITELQKPVTITNHRPKSVILRKSKNNYSEANNYSSSTYSLINIKLISLALYARGKDKITFGGGGGYGHNNLIATILLVCDMKQSPNLACAYIQFSTHTWEIFSTTLTKIMKTYIPINHLICYIASFCSCFCFTFWFFHTWHKKKKNKIKICSWLKNLKINFFFLKRRVM
jgi:hypothetical protein